MTDIDLSQLEGVEQIVPVDETKAIKYKVEKEEIDLEALKREKETLETQLNIPEPTEEELIELGKGMHPYYQDKTWILGRIKEIEEVLNNYG